MTDRQLAFDLPVRTARGRENFFVSPANADALAAIDGWQDWPGGRMILTGPPGSGKTHLTHVWAAETGAPIVAAGALTTADVPGLAAQGAAAIEDADRGMGDEVALFHLHNLMFQTGAALLITGTEAPGRWPLTLPDLASRITASPTTALNPPDEALLQAVMVKLFADRQIAVSPALIDFLTKRIERSFNSVQTVVNRLDSAALARGRPVTRALAAQLLDMDPPPDA